MAELTPGICLSWDNIHDLSTISGDINQIEEILINRAERGKIFTWTGSLLLSVNLNNEIPENIFNDENQIKYSNDLEYVKNKLDPHIYTVANQARYRLMEGLGKPNQCIVLIGESGTGKTYNAWKIVEFLAQLDKNLRKPRSAHRCNILIHKIRNVRPLIAAFSTASTEINAQSSRHGGLIKLQYMDDNISGVYVHSVLFDDIRVVNGSDNFIIFYQMMAGLSEDEMQELKLSWKEKYSILGSDYKRSEYLGEFSETIEAMEILGFSEECKKDIFQILGLLIHMGNINFIEEDGEISIDFKTKESLQAFENVCHLTRVTNHELINILTSIMIQPSSDKKKRNTMYRRYLETTEECRSRLSSIIRCLYTKLFRWLIVQVNDILAVKDVVNNSIEILDIPGFESFRIHNGFEQIYMNYAAERLHSYFTHKYLENNQKEFEKEGLIIPHPSVINFCKERLAVIEDELFSSINNEDCQTIMVVSSENTKQFLEIKDNSFIINHYSYPVTYSLQDVIKKNINKISTELSIMFHQSENNLLQKLVNDGTDHAKNLFSKNIGLINLKESLDFLEKELNKCDVQYIRCVRPKYDNHGLVYSGILDALQLAKCKLSIHFTCKEFSQRYSIIQEDTTRNWRQSCLMVLKDVYSSLNLRAQVYVGSELIFLTETLFFELEELRKIYLGKHSNVLVKKIGTDTINNYPSLIFDNYIEDEWKRIDIAKWINSSLSTSIFQTEKLDDENKNKIISIAKMSHISFQFTFRDASGIKWNRDGTSCIISHKNFRMFYQPGVLSRRYVALGVLGLVGQPTDFRRVVIQVELPRGLQDCL